MRKYYFAYHDVNGLIFPLAWAEDGGICVGGRPKVLPNTIHEITETQFEGDLLKLEIPYPIPLDDPTSKVKG